VVVGNAMTRGNPAVEYMLNAGLAYTSGPQWLAENVLREKWVLAVAGTHGKTTTSSMLAWILEYAGMAPGFLIGGVPANFGLSARRGGSDFFVVEADEYDTAFFDKRSKFVHYRPRTLVVNNLEFDHADIFPDLAAIQRQFHHLLRCVPGEGLVLHPPGVAAIDAVLAMGCWTPAQTFGIGVAAHWPGELRTPDAASFTVTAPIGGSRDVEWGFLGRHNAENALAAIAAAYHVGVPLEHSVAALRAFRGVKRRLELLGQIGGITVYDDFAHHPTAIATTLQGLRASSGEGRVIALIEPRSNTMRMGQHRAQLAECTREADQVYWFQPAGMNWSLEAVISGSPVPATLSTDVRQLARQVTQQARPGDRVVIMSNGGFGGIHQLLLDELEAANS